MNQQSEILFHTNAVFAGQTGIVDSENCVINGVSIIQKGEAEGHGLTVDDTTLKQLHALAKTRGQVPVNLNHSSGIEATCGYLTDFRLDGDKIRANWHLLKSHSETAKLLEMAERMPRCYGMSAAFKGAGKMEKGVNCARAEKLLSVDCVTRPATGNGLFSAKENITMLELRDLIIKLSRGEEIEEAVDSSHFSNPKIMAKNNSQENAEPTIADLMALVQQQGEQIAALTQHVQSQGQEGEGDVRSRLESLYNATDAELEQAGLTRAEVNAAVAQYNAEVAAEGEGNGEQGAEGEGEGAGELAGAGAGAAAGGGEYSAASGNAGGTSLNALQREVIQLRAEINRDKKLKLDEAENIQFAAIDAKMTALHAQRDQAIELAESLVAENEALRLANRTGTRPVKIGVDEGLRLFGADDNGELHEFQKLIKAKMAADPKLTQGGAIMLASKEAPALHRDYLEKGANGRIIHA